MTITIRPRYMFAIGLTLAALKNVQLSLIDPPHVIDERRIPFLGPTKERALEGSSERVGWINMNMHWDSVDKALWASYMPTVWVGGYLVSSAPLYATWIDESGFYSPYAVELDRPVEGEDYKAVVGNKRLQNLKIKGFHWQLQALDKTANYTVTTADRLIRQDTTSGDKTDTLPAASAPEPYTVFSFWNYVGTHNLIVARAGSDLIDGATSVTLGPGVRADFYSVGGGVWKRVIWYA